MVIFLSKSFYASPNHDKVKRTFLSPPLFVVRSLSQVGRDDEVVSFSFRNNPAAIFEVDRGRLVIEPHPIIPSSSHS